MRVIPSLLAASAIAASVVPAAAQAPQPLPPSVFTTAPESVVRSVAPLRGNQGQNRTDVVERIMSFDRNGDNRIVRTELPERMAPLFDRGDADADGVLILTEVILLVDRQSATTPTESFAVRTKAISIADVISDLRLEKPTHEAVMEILKNYPAVRYVNNSRQVGQLDVNTYLRGVLSDEEFENYEAAAARMRTGPFVLNGAVLVKP